MPRGTVSSFMTPCSSGQTPGGGRLRVPGSLSARPAGDGVIHVHATGVRV